jgi:hypothetical protein
MLEVLRQISCAKSHAPNLMRQVSCAKSGFPPQHHHKSGRSVTADRGQDDMQSLRKSIDATPEAASAPKALSSSQVVAINIVDGVLTMFAKTA